MGTKGNDNNIKKKAFIDAYRKAFGNVTQACSLIQLSRKTYYEWLREDIDFKQEIQEIEPNEILVDFAENALIKKIQDGDTTAIIFTLKTKGKKRGYIERADIGLLNSDSTKPIIKFISKGKQETETDASDEVNGI